MNNRRNLLDAVAEMADRILVGRCVPERQFKEPHPTQPVPDHELHARIRQIVLCLKDQRLMEWPTPTSSISPMMPWDHRRSG
jgi:hypothetical protein